MNWRPISEAWLIVKDGGRVHVLFASGREADCVWNETHKTWADQQGLIFENATHFMLVTPPGEQQLHAAFQQFKSAIQADNGYAWSWHCNIAMAFVDEGALHGSANLAAARFMRTCFDIDVTQFSEWDIEPGEQQPDVNQRLLDAATQALLWIESDESIHGRQFGTGNELRAAVKAASQVTKPSNELKEPINDAWLSKLFYIQPGRGFVVGRVLSIFNTKTGYYLFAGKDGADDSDETFKISDVLTTKGQLLAILDGIGLRAAIDAAKQAKGTNENH